jgi:ATP adenylyltransferase
MAYVAAGEPVDGCVFCAALAQGDDRAQYIVERGPTAFLILNRYPYASGHLMAVVNRHVGSLEDLEGAEQAEVLALARRAMTALRTVYQPHGFNLGANVGRAAGAGVEGHFHLHVVPRWIGDTNFMPVVGSVKVMPETLDESFRRLRAALLSG